MTVDDYKIDSGYRPGLIGRIAEMHGTYYHEHWDFGLYFEAKVATELSEFFARMDPGRDGVWHAARDGRAEGAVVIDGIHGEDQGAHLRWFILSHALRGKGAGRQLLERAVVFSRQAGYEKIYLWTFQGLHAARHLYETAGFSLVSQNQGAQWGTVVNEQCFELRL